MFVTKKYLLSTLALLLSIASLHAIATTSTTEINKALEPLAPLEPLDIHQNTTKNIVAALGSRHYADMVLDDDLSARIFDSYLSDLDPSKSYFLSSDIAQFESYRYEMDNSLRGGNLEPAFTIFNLYHDRVIDRFEKIIASGSPEWGENPFISLGNWPQNPGIGIGVKSIYAPVNAFYRVRGSFLFGRIARRAGSDQKGKKNNYGSESRTRTF